MLKMEEGDLDFETRTAVLKSGYNFYLSASYILLFDQQSEQN